MINLKIGDKLKCDNGHTYTLKEGNGFYTFSIVDEFGEVVNLAHDYTIVDSINSNEDYYEPLCVGTEYNGHLKRTNIVEYIPL